MVEISDPFTESSKHPTRETILSYFDCIKSAMTMNGKVSPMHGAVQSRKLKKIRIMSNFSTFDGLTER